MSATNHYTDIQNTAQGHAIRQPQPPAGYASRPAAPSLKTGIRPGTVNPGRVFRLPFELDFIENPESFILDLPDPGSTASNKFQRLIAGAGLRTPGSPTNQSIITVAGNSLCATGLAATLSQQGERVALLEFGYDHSLLRYLFSIADAQGLSDLMRQETTLQRVLSSARVEAGLPNLYVFHQGLMPVDWLTRVAAMNALIATLGKRFNRIILSVPDLESHHRVLRVLSKLPVPYMMAFDSEQYLSVIQRFLPESVIHLV
ncbi:MAG: hypothetical protein AB7P76_08320 [Candidatus Melainabacteria bacterium]